MAASSMSLPFSVSVGAGGALVTEEVFEDELGLARLAAGACVSASDPGLSGAGREEFGVAGQHEVYDSHSDSFGVGVGSSLQNHRRHSDMDGCQAVQPMVVDRHGHRHSDCHEHLAFVNPLARASSHRRQQQAQHELYQLQQREHHLGHLASQIRSGHALALAELGDDDLTTRLSRFRPASASGPASGPASASVSASGAASNFVAFASAAPAPAPAPAAAGTGTESPLSATLAQTPTPSTVTTVTTGLPSPPPSRSLLGRASFSSSSSTITATGTGTGGAPSFLHPSVSASASCAPLREKASEHGITPPPSLPHLSSSSSLGSTDSSSSRSTSIYSPEANALALDLSAHPHAHLHTQSFVVHHASSLPKLPNAEQPQPLVESAKALPIRFQVSPAFAFINNLRGTNINTNTSTSTSTSTSSPLQSSDANSYSPRTHVPSPAHHVLSSSPSAVSVYHPSAQNHHHHHHHDSPAGAPYHQPTAAGFESLTQGYQGYTHSRSNSSHGGACGLPAWPAAYSPYINTHNLPSGTILPDETGAAATTQTSPLSLPSAMAQHGHYPLGGIYDRSLASQGGYETGANQHQHQRPSNDTGEPSTKRKRIQQACRACGIKRVKCDGGKPCSTCIKVGETCEYGQPKKRGPPKGSTRGGSKAAKRAAELAASNDARKKARDAALKLDAQPSTASRFNEPTAWHRSQRDGHAQPVSYASAPAPAPPEQQMQRKQSLPSLQSLSQDPYHPHSSADASSISARSPGTRKHPETYYRGSSSGLGILRGASGDRKLPPLFFDAEKEPIRPRSADTATSPFFKPNDPGRQDHKGLPYSVRTPASDGGAHSRNASFSSATLSAASSPAHASASTYRGPPSVDGGSGSSIRPIVVRQSTQETNRFLQGSLQQMRADTTGTTTAAASGSRSQAMPDDHVRIEPLLSGDSSSSDLVITLTEPQIPDLVLERVFTIVWGIVVTIWPALYRPALPLINNRIIDPAKQPLLSNAVCALAAVAWDDGNMSLPEVHADITPSDWVERKASALASGSVVGSSTQSRPLTTSDLSNIFFTRAKYHLLKTNFEPSLEAIQALLFMALRESGNGKANQLASYQAMACRMALDLGLHRRQDSENSLGTPLTHEEEQAQRRAFWCCYIMDKTTAATLGRPPVLRDVEIDCPFPNFDEHDEHESWADMVNSGSLVREGARENLMQTPISAMSVLHSGIKLAQICERTIALYNSVREKLEPERQDESWEAPVYKIHKMIEDLERNLPPKVAFDAPANRTPGQLCLHLWLEVNKIILHRPYILKSPSVPGMPSSHQVCTDAVGRVCEILTAYETNFGMRKLSSTFVYGVFTASTVEIANTTSTDPAVSSEAKRRLGKLMGWLSSISRTWSSASHHLTILQQLGHGIDADLDGIGLFAHQVAGAVAPPSADAPLDSANNGQMAAAATNNAPLADQHAMAPTVSIQGPDSSTIPYLSAESSGLANAPSPGLLGLTGLVPGPLGAPMDLSRSRAGLNASNQMQLDMRAQQQAGQLSSYGAENVAGGSADSSSMGISGLLTPGTLSSLTDGFPGSAGSSSNAATTGDVAVTAATAADKAGAGAGAGAVAMANASLDPNAFLKLHDMSYWGAMPLSSEDPMSWAKFTSSYFEALNGMITPNPSLPVVDGAGAAAGGSASGDGSSSMEDASTVAGAGVGGSLFAPGLLQGVGVQDGSIPSASFS